MKKKVSAHTPVVCVSDYLVYKDYYGTMRIDIEQDMLFGHVIGMNDKIIYQGRTVKALEKDFQESVDEYIELCNEVGKKPEKSFTGNILFRATSQRHSKIALAAQHCGKSINAWLSELVDERLKNEPTVC